MERRICKILSMHWVSCRAKPLPCIQLRHIPLAMRRHIRLANAEKISVVPSFSVLFEILLVATLGWADSRRSQLFSLPQCSFRQVVLL